MVAQQHWKISCFRRVPFVNPAYICTIRGGDHYVHILATSEGKQEQKGTLPLF